MADYVTIQAAIDAGTTNMTVLRNHSRNDDGTSTYATGIDWFKFNNVVVSNIYSSGNSWLGFGVSSEQLRVNRRDCAVWDEFSEKGTIGVARFYKFTWKGTSDYNSSREKVDSYQQYFDVFLFDTGQILLRFFKVPTSSFDGTRQLVCGSQTVSYSVTAGTPVEYTFTPSDITSGTGWSVSTERPAIDAHYKSSGTAIITLASYISGGDNTLYWTADIPTGTSVSMSASVNNGSWQSVNNGSVITGMTAGQIYNLRIKVDLSTTDITVTPSVSQIKILTDDDRKIMVLGLNVPNISGAIGNAEISYDGLGALAGVGGPTEAFEGTFTPSGMTWKGHQNDEEHIELNSIKASVIVTLVLYHDTKSADEHIELGLTANVILTDIHDL